MVTEQEARDMKIAIDSFQSSDEAARQAQQQADLTRAEQWFNTLGIDIQAATTRRQALKNYNDIEILISTETDRFRLSVLRTKLKEANEKYKEVKRLSP